MNESLAYFWVRFDGDPTPFEAGQYMTIGVMVDGKLVQRPYSVASPPAVAGSDGYEFYVRLVDGGTFTPLLWRMPVGHGMRMIGPKGKFMLQPDDDRTHIFISSGTGNAPFVSMMRQLMIDGAPAPGRLPQRRLVRRGARLPDVLDELGGFAATYPVTYVPTVSRAPIRATRAGRAGPAGSRRSSGRSSTSSA